MKWQFWLGTMSAILNILFIIDFAAYAFTGQSLAALCFTDDHGSLADVILTVYPEMTTGEFLAANGILLGISVVLVLLSIWIAYATSGIIVDDSDLPGSCDCKKVAKSCKTKGVKP